jgi:hypothetical protein
MCQDTLCRACVFASSRICRARSAFRCIRGTKRRCTFFLLRLDQYGFHKKHVETHYAELVFLHLMGSAGHIVHTSASGMQNVDALFSILGWAKCSFHINMAGLITTKLCVLHQVGSAVHVAQNVDALFFVL